MYGSSFFGDPYIKGTVMYKFTLDSFISIGSSHSICQDYVLIGNEDDPCIVLSDGCSSSPHTDIGARILCCSAMSNRKRYSVDGNGEAYKTAVIQEASVVSDILKLPIECLDCTLLIIRFDSIGFVVEVIGDGCVVARNRNVTLKTRRVMYKDSMPFYLSYELNIERKNRYEELCMKKYGSTRNKIHENTFCSEIDIDDWPFYYPSTCYFYPDHYDFIGIMSDGVESFVHSKTGHKISADEIIKKLTLFKNHNGEFIQRRVKRAIKELEAEGYKHYDDISFAGIFIEKE